jgi:flagellar motor switch protein FliM
MTFVDESLETSAIDLLASALTPQLRSVLMESLSDIIMRKIAFSLSQRMRCPVQLLSCVNGVISHDSAVSALPDVMLAGIADLAPLHGRIIIGVEGDLIGAVVDAMFGATSSDFVNRHELSSMEQRIGKQMIELTLAGLCEVLSSFTPLNWTIVQYETAVGMLASRSSTRRWQPTAAAIKALQWSASACRSAGRTRMWGATPASSAAQACSVGAGLMRVTDP